MGIICDAMKHHVVHYNAMPHNVLLMLSDRFYISPTQKMVDILNFITKYKHLYIDHVLESIYLLATTSTRYVKMLAKVVFFVNLMWIVHYIYPIYIINLTMAIWSINYGFLKVYLFIK